MSLNSIASYSRLSHSRFFAPSNLTRTAVHRVCEFSHMQVACDRISQDCDQNSQSTILLCMVPANFGPSLDACGQKQTCTSRRVVGLIAAGVKRGRTNEHNHVLLDSGFSRV